MIRTALLVSDSIGLVAAGLFATWVRFGQIRHVPAVRQLGERATFAWFTFLIAGVWIACFAYEHLYDPERVFWGTGEYSRVLRGLSLGIVGFTLLTYMLKIPVISRGWMLLTWVLGGVVVIGGRAAVRAMITAARRRGRLMRPTLVVGCSPEAASLIRSLKANPSSGLVPIGCLASSKVDQLNLDYSPEDVAVLGSAGEVRQVLVEHEVDTVVIVSTAFEHDVLARIINDLRGLPVDIEMSSGLFDVATRRILIREVSGVPLITISGVAFTPWRRFVKRTFDLVVGGAIIIVGLPAWLLAMLAIKVDSRGPVFYRQERVGKFGQTFRMLKFRSMVADADERLRELASENEATGPMFKIHEDPRMTRVGRWLRKYSVDEFPQLINVMRGEMSLVGPRPPLPNETSEYTDAHWRRLEVLPGMTGLWQVSGRSGVTFDEMVRLDLFYIENWSIGFDLSILMRTVPVVLLARGAY